MWICFHQTTVSAKGHNWATTFSVTRLSTRSGVKLRTVREHFRLRISKRNYTWRFTCCEMCFLFPYSLTAFFLITPQQLGFQNMMSLFQCNFFYLNHILSLSLHPQTWVHDKFPPGDIKVYSILFYGAGVAWVVLNVR